MIPTDFPESNISFIAPDDIAESQCRAIRAYRGHVEGGSLDGVAIAVVAWTPTPEELARLNEGKPIFLTACHGGLPMHMLTTSFQEATHPA